MLDSFFLVIAAKSLLDKISIKQNLKRKVIENGWNHPEWNKVRQEMLFDKYLWNVGSCPEQEFMTTWELYQYAQKELKDKMIDRAVEKGVLDIAKSNAETVLGGMLASPTGEYEVKIEWQ